MSPLSVRKIKKVYKAAKPFTAVDEISFDLKEGEILGLLGPNGSGKTTTIQMLLGTLTPSSGEILYFGKDFSKHRTDALQSVTFASTYTNLPYLLTVAENLNVFGKLYGVKNVAEKTIPLLDRFGILEKRHQPISSLSAGQLTRLMLVKAFFTDPKIVLLDEPTASLDPDVSQDVCRFLLEERKKRGLSILFTSHKMEEVMELCDRAIFLKEGKIVADDLPKNLARQISSYAVQLTIAEDINKAALIAGKMGIAYEIDHRFILLRLEEKEIPLILNAYMREGIIYSSIRIEEPSLDDYFRQLAERKKK